MVEASFHGPDFGLQKNKGSCSEAKSINVPETLVDCLSQPWTSANYLIEGRLTLVFLNI